MAKRTPQETPLGIALETARRTLAMKRVDLEEAIGVSNKTLRRWELDEGDPNLTHRDGVIAWATSIPRAVGEPILRALGAIVEFPSTPGGAGGPGAQPSAGAAEVTDRAFHRLAEAIDVGPRTLRDALVAFLGELAHHRVDVATAHARLVAGATAAKRPSPTPL